MTITKFYIDESGNTGDLCKVGAHPDFGGQRMFTLACVGVSDLAALEEEICRLKSLHRLQGEELKSTRTSTTLAELNFRFGNAVGNTDIGFVLSV